MCVAVANEDEGSESVEYVILTFDLMALLSANSESDVLMA